MVNEENSKKLNPQGFALWKKLKDDEPFFDSMGQKWPGCFFLILALIKDELGDTIDIHLVVLI